MDESAHNDGSDVWTLNATRAILRTPQLNAGVDLLRPRAGLGQLAYGGSAFDGSILGVAPGTFPLPSPGDLTDRFVRGTDLVATYAATTERPFSLQVYWRATTTSDGAVVLDAILSLQTDLLESFPGIAIETTLPTGECTPLEDAGADARLIRPDDVDWSYAETAHPDDAGQLQISESDGDLRMVRQLGGRFLEKGVIRRLRVRGIFLPRDGDEATATTYLTSLVAEEPPLTV